LWAEEQRKILDLSFRKFFNVVPGDSTVSKLRKQNSNWSKTDVYMIQNYYIEFAEKTYLKRNEQWLIVRLQGCIMWHFLDILQFSMLTNKTASYIFKKWESLEGLQAH